MKGSKLEGPSTLEGEASGSNYGTVGSEQQAARPEPLLNGVAREPTATTSSNSANPAGIAEEVPLQRATGSGEHVTTAESVTMSRVGTREVTVDEQQPSPAPQQSQ